MDKNDFMNMIFGAIQQGTLMTPKHNPNNLGNITWPSYRSVLSYDLANNLDIFFKSELFDVIEYENSESQHSPEYYEIIPLASTFSIPASGVMANDLQAIEALDRLIVVNGANQGLHIFGENSNNIQQKSKTGKLIRKNKLS